MTDTPPNEVSPKTPKENEPQDEDVLAELRSLLVGPEQAQLIQVQDQLDSVDQMQVEDLSQMLPEAIVLRSKQDKQLTKVLAPTIEESVNFSVTRNPRPFADAISPVMMPAIRKAISQMLARLVQSVNQTLEHSFSLRSFKWRLEALRTGKSFAEVVLFHTLLYRVEQVFLIQRDTGLLLQHVVAEAVVAPEAEMISAMLTAIENFVQDAFSASKEDMLERMQVGELTVWIEPGPQAILAAVIRGTPREELRLALQEALETIHIEQHDAIESFQGDATPFEASRPHLEACLQTQLEEKERKTSPLLWIILSILIVGLGLWGFSYIRESRRWADYVNQLSAEPGIVVTDTEKRRGKYFIAGLRDPLAANPTTILKTTRLNPEKVVGQWEPYQALSPEFIVARARHLLEPSATVILNVRGEVLYATGTAPHQWIIEARKLVRAIAGISQFHDNNLIDTDVRELESHKERVEKQVIRFIVGTIQLVPGQNDALQGLVTEIQDLDDVAQIVGASVYIEIIGHSSSDGPEQSNMRLRRQRADFVLSALVPTALKSINITAVGTGKPLRKEMTEEDKAFNRSVSFKVILTYAARK